jgi:hypothetical protein
MLYLPGKEIHVLFVIVILLLYVMDTKIFEGRPIWHSPRKIWTSSLGGKNDDSSQQLFDIYTLTHISHGIIFYTFFHSICKLPPIYSMSWSMILEIVWELIENTNYVINKYRKTTVSRYYPGDSWINSIGDIWATYVGILIAMNASISVQTIIVVCLELFLYLLQGDNLLTNIMTIFSK